MERCSLVVIVRAGAVWSGVGTLAVALGGGRSLLLDGEVFPGSHSKGGSGVERGGDPCGRPGWDRRSLPGRHSDKRSTLDLSVALRESPVHALPFSHTFSTPAKKCRRAMGPSCMAKPWSDTMKRLIRAIQTANG